MSWRIAVTSADGVLINQHFGHALWFFIIDVERDGSFSIAERREARPWCGRGHCASPAGNETSEAAASPAENLAGCKALLTARIGPPAKKQLELAGITVFERIDSIENAVKKLAAYWGTGP